MNKMEHFITIRDFKNDFRNGGIWTKETLIREMTPLQKTIYDLWLHVEDLDISKKEIAQYFAPIWKISRSHALHYTSHDLVCPKDWEIRSQGSYMRNRIDKEKMNGEIDAQRMSDYLFHFGYTEIESRQIFSQLVKLSDLYTYKNPNAKVEVHPKAKVFVNLRKSLDSLDSMEGIR